MSEPRMASNRWMVLFIASIASFMAPFDGSVVNIALPAITRSLEATFTDIILISTVYLVVIASFQTSFGRLGDRSGMKRVFVLGVAVFTIGSFLAGLSGGVPELLAFRIVQGVGAAMMSAIASALIVTAFPAPERGRALGINLSAVYVGLTAGPFVGGILVQVFGWRSIFYVNVPIGIVTVVLAYLYLKEERTERARSRFDFPGAISLITFLTTLLLALSGLGLSLWELGALVLTCLGSFVSFVFLERRPGIMPLVDLRLFTQNRTFAAGNATSLMNYTTSSGALLVMSLYLQEILGYSPFEAGLILLVQPVVMVIVAPISGALSDRVSARILSSLGMLTRVVAFLMLSQLGLSSSGATIWFPLTLVGLGHALFSSPNTNSIMSSVPREEIGLASGTLGTVRSAAQSIGVAILGGVVASSMPAGAFETLSEGGSVASGGIAQLFIMGMHEAFLIAALLSAIGVISSLVRGKDRRPAR
jgi:EmrB/QacA subfamily drug resistance transporter